MIVTAASAALCVLAGCAAHTGAQASSSAPDAPAPPDAPLLLTPLARLGHGARKEISGIVRGRRDPSVFWTLNDSGDQPRIYPVRADGAVVACERYPDQPGTLIGGAINGDWEAIALDASGRVVVADVGNNSNARADLTLYFVQEPEPSEGRTTYTSKVMVRYPDQTSLPAPKSDFNFDAEAVFTIGNEVYILTKHRSDTQTKLYRLDRRDPGVINTLEFLARFDIGGQVTAADASPNGLTLAVLTYERIILFERSSLDQPFFQGRVRSRGYRYADGDSDSEAVCFETDRTLLIADESRGTLYRVRLDDLSDEGPR